MQYRIKSLIIITCFAFLQSACFSQEAKNYFLNQYENIRSEKLTSLKTNTLAEIFQASINSGIITTNGTDIGLKSTIFQLHKIWKPDIINENNYVKQTFARNFEFGIGIKINGANKINAFGTSVKYAIINNRDISLQNKKYMDKDIAELNGLIDGVVKQLHNGIALRIENAINRSPQMIYGKDSSKRKIIENALDTFTAHNSSAQALQQLGVDLKNFYNDLDMKQSDFAAFNYGEVRQAISKKAEALEDNIKKRGLLTFNFGSNYKEKGWDSLNVNLEYIKGLGNVKDKDKPWDIYAAAFYDFKQDTVSKSALGRQIFTAKFGINKVLLKNKKENNSFLEILGAAQYTHVLKGLYAKESKGVFMADFILSIRLSATLFLPLELKYDPKNANVFGFLKVKWDMPRTHDKK